MKITLLVVGKTEKGLIHDGIGMYLNRLKHYIPFEIIEIAVKKKSDDREVMKRNEGEGIMKQIKSSDHVILLDSMGREYTSKEFSQRIQHFANKGYSNCVFIIGGPFGFHSKIIDRADEKLSMSRMTFSHQMIRLFFVEQLYRGMTILKGELYHH